MRPQVTNARILASLRTFRKFRRRIFGTDVMERDTKLAVSAGTGESLNGAPSPELLEEIRGSSDCPPSFSCLSVRQVASTASVTPVQYGISHRYFEVGMSEPSVIEAAKAVQLLPATD